MSTRLDPILADVRRREAERRRARPLASLRRDCPSRPERGRSFVRALSGTGLGLIAECKRRSPSAGELARVPDVAERAGRYARGGADALSILTEEDHFGGSLADLAAAAEAGLPRLRKDFLLTEGMVLESAAAGADAVLLLAACLSDGELADLRGAARELGLAVLLEVHDERELERALPLEPECLGVNARDLRTFDVDLSAHRRLLPKIPRACLRVAESGMRTAADLARARAAGADAVLVGEALMRASDPETILKKWKEEF